jgi:hypothetical protein
MFVLVSADQLTKPRTQGVSTGGGDVGGENFWKTIIEIIYIYNFCL